VDFFFIVDFAEPVHQGDRVLSAPLFLACLWPIAKRCFYLKLISSDIYK